MPTMADPRPDRWLYATALAQARRSARLTQRDVACALGVTQTTVSRWERGRRQPTQTQGRQLAELFGCPFEMLALAPDEEAP